MENRIANTNSGLVLQGSKALAGLTEYAVALALAHSTEAAVTAQLTNLITGTTNGDLGKTELASRRLVLRTLNGDARTYGYAARNVLKTYFGQTYNQAWNEAGFVGSLKVPRTVDALLTLLLKLKAHFTAHPEHENALLNVTAVRANTFYNDITAARNAVNSQRAIVQLLLEARNANGELLRFTLRGLLKELGIKLPPLDARWRAFGFNLPGAESTPDVPKDVEVVLVGTNALSVKWGAAARAQYYRVWKKVNGVDEELIPVGSPADLDFLLESLPANATVQIAISAVNNGGESLKSEIVSITL